jgi:hypothetical protein
MPVRAIYALSFLLVLPACQVIPTVPPVDLAIGGAATYLLFGDELEQVKAEDLDTPEEVGKAARGMVPPQAKSAARRTVDNVRDNVRYSSRKMKEWWFYDPNKPEQKQMVGLSYCYRALQDVLCYRQPVPGWEYRLVGYQGTGATPPPPSITQPLPKIAMQADNPAASRVASSQPVFKAMPQDAPEEKKDVAEGEEGAEVQTPSAQELLPDPALAPQL